MNAGWVNTDGKTFVGYANSFQSLPTGVYNFHITYDGTKQFIRQDIPSDEALDLPGLPSKYITDQIEDFWDREKTYEKFRFLNKRGILLYGPPGCGKTSIIRLLINNIIKRNGIIFSITDFIKASSCISWFRTLDPSRPVMTLMEDVEGVFNGDGGPAQVQSALSFLDGQSQIRSVVHIATTNKPEDLADRFIKRPGRFDLVIGIHAPSAETRRAYLRHVSSGCITDNTLEELVVKTEGLTLAYLRELVSAYLCLDIPLETTLSRLQNNFKMKSLCKKETKLGFTVGYEPEG